MPFGYGHCGVDVGETVAQNARARQRRRLGNQAGAVQCDRVDASGPQQFKGGGNAVRPDQFSSRERTGQAQIRCIAARNRDTNSLTIRVSDALDGGPGGHQIGEVALDERVRKIHLLRAHRVDNEDGNIPGAIAQPVDHRTGPRIFDAYEFDAHSLSDRAPQLQRRSLDLAGRWLSYGCRQTPNAKPNAQHPGLHEICDAGIWRLLSERCPACSKNQGQCGDQNSFRHRSVLLGYAAATRGNAVITPLAAKENPRGAVPRGFRGRALRQYQPLTSALITSPNSTQRSPLNTCN